MIVKNTFLFFSVILKMVSILRLKRQDALEKPRWLSMSLSIWGGYTYIYIDIRRAASLQQMANNVLDSAYALTGIQNFIYRAKNRSIELFKLIQKIKIESIGEVTLQMTENKVDELEFLMHALDTVDKIASSQGENIIFVMDEFQDISHLGDKSVLNKLRSVMQHHEHVTYVFLGSVESMMTRIFEDKSSPFFHFSRIMVLKGLDVGEVFEYCDTFFSWHNYKVVDDDLMAMLDFLEGHPDYTAQTLQRIYYALLESPTKVVDKALCIECLADVFMENKAYLEELVSKAKLKKYHYEVLIATANKLSFERGQYALVDVFLRLYVCIKQTDL